MVKVTFGQRSEGNEDVNHVDIWEKSISGRRDRKCKCPEAESLLDLFEKARRPAQFKWNEREVVFDSLGK